MAAGPVPPRPGRRRLVAGAGTGLLAAIGAPIVRAAPKQPAEAPLGVAFVYVSPVSDGGWTYQHNQGRIALEKALGPKVRTRYVDKVPEGPDAERVIRDLAGEGNQLIVATSFGYMDPTIRVARAFPDVAFEHASGYKTADNVAVYNARFYEGRYLAGLLAGHSTRSEVLGYVAAMPIPEVIQGINAFTIAARSVNPKIVTRVIWTNSWYDPARERDAALTLIGQQADVVTHHTDSTAVLQVVEEKGVLGIGYHSNMSRVAPKSHLVSVTHQWGGYYESRARALLDGTWTTRQTLGGIADGFVRLEALSPKLPNAALRLVAQHTREIADGKRDPFVGPLRSNEGKLRLDDQARLTDDEVGRMDWLIEGVLGKI